jgi:hypothetical protein
VGLNGEQCGTEAGFHYVLLFPLPIVISLAAALSSGLNICGCYNGPIVVGLPSGLSLTIPYKLKRVGLRHYATSWKVTGFDNDVNECFSV